MSNAQVGDLIDSKYRLVHVIGEGGLGIVFEAENLRTLKRVAVKILRARHDLGDEMQLRFEREAQAAGRIGSEHIVEVFDLGTLEDGTHYLVMELLSGEDLATHLRFVGTLDPVPAAQLVIQLLDGLAAAHRAGILHRDLKPENLFLVPTRGGEDFVKILDFGISKFSAPGITSATTTGAVLGSPTYMAPEQARGMKHVDARTDVYSVGTVLFECVVGRVPFLGENFNDLMFKIALAPRPDPRELRPDLDPALAAIILKAIAAEPAARYESAETFRTALLEWLEAQGVMSVEPPDPRRAIRSSARYDDATRTTTPRAHGSGPARGSGGPAVARWNDPTLPVERGSSTPLAATSTVQPTRGRRSQGAVVALIGAAATLTVVGAVVFQRAYVARRALEGAAAPSDPPSLSPAVPLPDVAPSSSFAVNPAPPAPLVPTPAASGSAPPVARSNGPRAPHGGFRPPPMSASAQPGTSGASGKGPKAVASASSTPPAASSIQTVEGREFRTGL